MWHFVPLDGGQMLLDLDEITQHTGGNVVYYGQAHTRRILHEIINKKYDAIRCPHWNARRCCAWELSTNYRESNKLFCLELLPPASLKNYLTTVSNPITKT